MVNGKINILYKILVIQNCFVMQINKKQRKCDHEYDKQIEKLVVQEHPYRVLQNGSKELHKPMIDNRRDT